jgi:MFS-type transporter involved in bile tolerance (Atg22 family)
MKKSQVFLWTLYDFANSISVGVFSLYFSQWLVIDKKVPDLWFNMIFVGATLLLIFSAPIAGSVADKTNSKIKFLRYSTLLQFVFILAASLIAVCASFSVFNTALLIGVFLLANYFYQLTFTFYNPMLRDIAPAEKQGLVSGIGQRSDEEGVHGGRVGVGEGEYAVWGV